MAEGDAFSNFDIFKAIESYELPLHTHSSRMLKRSFPDPESEILTSREGGTPHMPLISKQQQSHEPMLYIRNQTSFLTSSNVKKYAWFRCGLVGLVRFGSEIYVFYSFTFIARGSSGY